MSGTPQGPELVFLYGGGAKKHIAESLTRAGRQRALCGVTGMPRVGSVTVKRDRQLCKSCAACARVDVEEVALPFKRGDIVSLPWLPDDRFRLVCIDGGEVWALDLSDGKHLTLGIDTIEHEKP